MFEGGSKEEALKQSLHLAQAKCAAGGQDLASHLEGWAHARFPTYWDYLRLDTLQNPRTDLPDETAFILFHQIAELQFKLCLLELDQAAVEAPEAERLARRVRRICGSFRTMTAAFGDMLEAMDPEQFKKFRLALQPTSGFQSVQYRLIEIGATDLENLLPPGERDQPAPAGADRVEWMVANLYWKRAVLDGGEVRPATLRQLEERYDGILHQRARERAQSNLWQRCRQVPEDAAARAGLHHALRELDSLANLHWPLAHYRTALRYLGEAAGGPASTGGTDWRAYLPPRFQKCQFFPALWTTAERENWGLEWVRAHVPAAGGAAP